MRLSILAAALATSLTLVVGATDANAQKGAYYVAVPEVEASRASLITRSTPWQRRGDAYVANRAPERDVVLCQLLARDLGKLRSFSAGGAALDGAALEKCNTRAKVAPVTAVAAR